jgi:hypothetical protein
MFVFRSNLYILNLLKFKDFVKIIQQKLFIINFIFNNTIILFFYLIGTH